MLGWNWWYVIILYNQNPQHLKNEVEKDRLLFIMVLLASKGYFNGNNLTQYVKISHPKNKYVSLLYIILNVKEKFPFLKNFNAKIRSNN